MNLHSTPIAQASGLRDAQSRRDAAPTGLALALAVFLSGPVQAAPPAAGEVLREIAPPAVMPPAGRIPALETPQDATRPALVEDAGLKVTARYFRVTGSSIYGEAELQTLLADLVGREIGFAELRAAAERITRHYRDHGYLLARAWLPTQSLTAGVIEINVLEGRVGDVRLVNRSGYSDADIAAFLDPNRLTGTIAERRLLERRLLLLADIPGFEVKAELVPGANVGVTDLNVEVQGTPSVQGAVSFDNHGNRYTGRYRFGGGMKVVNPGGWGDQVSLQGLLSHDGLTYARFGYDSAVGSDGLRLGAAWSSLHYVLGGDFGNLAAKGEANDLAVSAIYPLLRSVARNLYASAAWHDTQLIDRIGATASRSEKAKQVLNLGLSADWLGGGTSNSAAVSLSTGRLALNDPATQAQDDLTAHSAGGFHKLNLDFSQDRRLVDAFDFRARLRGQWAGKNLDSSEKLGLGGAEGVRAYPQGEAAGDDAFLVNLEARRALGRIGAGSPIYGSLFLDFGSSRINHSDWSGSDNRRNLSGLGFSLGWGDKANGSTRISFAQRLSGGPATAEPDSRSRIWIAYEEAL